MNTKLVDFFLNASLLVPAPVIHNIEKSRMIQKLIWWANVDSTEGDYFEFGVAQGNSIRAASIAIKRSSYRKIGVRSMPRRIFGFDTFGGFLSSDERDNHSIWSGSLYNDSYEKVCRRFAKNSEITLTKVDVCELSDSKGEQLADYKLFGIDSNKGAAVILFDLDLYLPTLRALNFMKPLMKQGTFILFDEQYYFAGDKTKGEQRARDEFLEQNPHIRFTYVSSYGSGGMVYLVSLDV
jgi:hypothetical protein